VLLAGVEVLIDAVTWIQLDVTAIYGLPLVLAARTRRRRLLWVLTALLILTIFVVYAVQIPAGAFALNETFFVNRVFGAVAVLVTAGLLHVWMTSAALSEAQARRLEAQNAALVRHEEQIARQNAELEHRRKEAEEASVRKTRLLAAASHDIRTPVNTINTLAEVIRLSAENPALAEQIPSLTRRLQTNALALVELVSAVLDNATFESGRVEYHESLFSLNELIASNCRELLPVAQTKGLRLEAELPQQPLWVRTDRVKLHRVISNLISNAIKFTETGGVTVSAAFGCDRAVMIRVRDTGVGIAPQQLENIFKEFAQVPSPDRDRKSGWGLGLAICRRLVNLMGGRITVESELNKGSTFTVQLPPSSTTREPNGARPAGLPMTVQPYP
jgi:signal transduction histidine kinase